VRGRPFWAKVDEGIVRGENCIQRLLIFRATKVLRIVM